MTEEKKPKIIREIEMRIGRELTTTPLDELGLGPIGGYNIDSVGNVCGLGLDEVELVDISFISGLSHLKVLGLDGNKIKDVYHFRP